MKKATSLDIIQQQDRKNRYEGTKRCFDEVFDIT